MPKTFKKGFKQKNKTKNSFRKNVEMVKLVKNGQKWSKTDLKN